MSSMSLMGDQDLPLRPAKRDMLQNMWHPRRIRRVRLESNREDIVLVFPGNVKILGSGLLVLEVQRIQFEGWKIS